MSDKCSKCGGSTVFYREKGPHMGVYCANCGHWLRWAGHDERNLILRLREEAPENARNSQARF